MSYPVNNVRYCHFRNTVRRQRASRANIYAYLYCKFHLVPFCIDTSVDIQSINTKLFYKIQ